MSIYPTHLLKREYTDPILPKKREEQTNEMLALAKFYTRNAFLSICEFEKRRLRKFDPLVRDSLCQRHTTLMLSLFEEPDLNEELTAKKEELDKVIKTIDRLMLRPPAIGVDKISAEDFISEHNLDVRVSNSSLLIFNAHLLTLGASFQIGSSGAVGYQTDCSYLRDRLSKKLSLDVVKEELCFARSIFSRQSAKRFPEIIQRSLASGAETEEIIQRITVKHPLDVNSSAKPSMATNAFYTMEAALRFIKEKKIPVIIKEHRLDKQPPKYLVYLHDEGKLIEGSKELLLPDAPVMVAQGFMPEGTPLADLAAKIEAFGLEELIMSNVSLCKQFTSGDHFELLDAAAVEEIEVYRNKAATGNSCGILKIVHVYPSTLKCEKLK